MNLRGNEPVQRRSRERVEQILAAAAQLINENGVSALSNRAIAERSGIPVPTVYRYFENSDAIVGAFLDREMEILDQAVLQAVLDLDLISLRTLTDTAVLAHLRHHQKHPFVVSLWFGGRQSAAVRARVKAQDARLAAWLGNAAAAAGLLRPDTPSWGAAMVVRICDRAFEFALLSEEPPHEQERMMQTFLDMVATQMERYATPAGLEGITSAQFAQALSPPPIHLDVETDAAVE